MKVVLDTNVWISSLLLRTPGKIVSAWQQAQFTIRTSDLILDEIRKVLSYPKIHKRLNMPQSSIDEYITFLRFFAEVIPLKKSAMNLSNKLRDPNDSPILLTFIESQSDYLITGDKDLLILGTDYPIISPQEFLKFLE